MENLNTSVALEVLTEDQRRIVVIASRFRRDVKDAGFGSGYHGFSIDTNEIKSTKVLIRFLESQNPVSNGFIELNPCNALTLSVLPDSFVSALQDVANELYRLTQQQSIDRPPQFRQLSLSGHEGSSIILAVQSPESDPEGLITIFLAQEALRCGYPRAARLTDCSLADRLDATFWYLSSYSRDRPGITPPLSDQQLTYLNRRASVANISPAVTNALLSFVLIELPDRANLLDEINLVEALYWWCVERPAIAYLDPRLITNEQVEPLMRYETADAQVFALTVFSRRFYERHSELHDLDMTVDRDRAALLIYLVLYSHIHPWIIRLLPRAGVRLLLQTSERHSPVFDEVLERHLASNKSSRSLREAGDAMLRSAGFAPLDAIFSRRERIDARPPPASHRAEDLDAGVTLIGSVRKTSGLGQAARLSARMLTACEAIAPTVVNFDAESPAPASGESVEGYAAYDGPREISILHLNADVIPQAFAFIPDALPKRSYKIGICVWELDKLAQCQRLALSLLDEIWVPSEYCRKTFEQYTEKPVVNVGMAVTPYNERPPMSRFVMGIDPNAFVFLASFDSFSFIERKNPVSTIRAFEKAFPSEKDVRLVLKTHNRRAVYDSHQVAIWSSVDGMIADDPRIILIDETFEHHELIDFMRGCNCFVSLHRSEGFGFGILEAMHLGLPVIATAYSGNMDFCSEDNCFLVPFHLIEAGQQDYIYVPSGSRWAEPDVDHAAKQMREILSDPVTAQSKARLAERSVAQTFSIKAIAERYARRLATIRQCSGQELHDFSSASDASIRRF